jgi:hypothetical protein
VGCILIGGICLQGGQQPAVNAGESRRTPPTVCSVPSPFSTTKRGSIHQCGTPAETTECYQRSNFRMHKYTMGEIGCDHQVTSHTNQWRKDGPTLMLEKIDEVRKKRMSEGEDHYAEADKKAI